MSRRKEARWKRLQLYGYSGGRHNRNFFRFLGNKPHVQEVNQDAMTIFLPREEGTRGRKTRKSPTIAKPRTSESTTISPTLQAFPGEETRSPRGLLLAQDMTIVPIFIIADRDASCPHAESYGRLPCHFPFVLYAT